MLPGFQGVLLILHQGVLTNSTTAPGLDEEEHGIALEREPAMSV